MHVTSAPIDPSESLRAPKRIAPLVLAIVVAVCSIAFTVLQAQATFYAFYMVSHSVLALSTLYSIYTFLSFGDLQTSQGQLNQIGNHTRRLEEIVNRLQPVADTILEATLEPSEVES